MTKIHDTEVIQAMLQYGGGFAVALGKAAQKADLDNLRKIKQAWPELWQQYAEMAEAVKARE